MVCFNVFLTYPADCLQPIALFWPTEFFQELEWRVQHKKNRKSSETVGEINILVLQWLE